jgi:hypothetical protein
MKTLIILLFCVMPFASADVYRSYDESGNVVFSDQPSANAEKINVEAAYTYTPVEVPLLEAIAEEDVLNEEEETMPAAPDYQVTIISPQDDEAIRANDGFVTINVQVRPPLSSRRGDQIQLQRDGLPYGPPQSQLSFVLPNMDRGTHNFAAVILNASGDELAASPVRKFHVLRTSIITNPNRNQPRPGLPAPRPAPSPNVPSAQ